MKKQLLTFLALLITGIISAQVGIGTTTPSQALDVETNEAGGTAIDINNTGTGDPKINLQLNGTTTFSIGVDNDDSDKLKIGTSAPETNTRVTIDNTGNVGVGTSTPTSTFDIQGSLGYKVNTITSATTLNGTHNVLLCNNGPYTITLPAANLNTGRVYKIKNIDPQGDIITIDANGSETIEGELTYALQPYKHSITIISDGANWHVIDNLSIGGSQVGTISTLTCGSATNNGTLVSGITASSVSSEIPYTGGNSGTHEGQTVTSTGVTGLTATLTAGVFASSGSLTYTITGTPASSGTATFALNIGGQTCNLTRTVNPGLITALTCGSATNNGTLVHGVAASGVNSEVPYTGGNAGPHSGQTVASTGVTGLTATLTAGVFASSGSLTYTITGTPASSGTATFALNIGGQTCNLTRTVNPGLITALTCGSATNNGYLTSGQAASGVTSVIPYTGGNAGTHSGQTVTSTGITGLTATLTAGTFASGSGNLTYTITGTPSGIGTATFALNIGGQTCNLTLTTYGVGTITGLTCGSATNNGTLSAGSSATGVTSVIPYTGGNGGTHSGQTVTSTGVTGLTATVSAGVFANGSGNLTYTITGNPDFEGTASFALNIGGRTCTLTRTVSCMAIGTNTTIVDVVSPTGKTWMDRNLGATRQATSLTDQAAYGDSYQWGRLKDGHQCRNSSTTATKSSSDEPGHGNYITTNHEDWRNPKNDNLWQGVNGTNNPCPSGYRIPTKTEWNAELATFSPNNSSSGAYNSVLKLTLGGYRTVAGNSFYGVGVIGDYHTSTIGGNDVSYVVIYGAGFYVQDPVYYSSRGQGRSVRCIKN
jgi:uncharacterized protein (TIGR02145 family)